MDKIYRQILDNLKEHNAKAVTDEDRFHVIDNLWADSALRKHARLSFEWDDELDPDIVEITFRIKFKTLLALSKNKKKSRSP